MCSSSQGSLSLFLFVLFALKVSFWVYRMWTVQEDEYKNTELSFSGLELSPLSGTEDAAFKPIGVYTKSSQVFVNTSTTPLTGTPPNDRCPTATLLPPQRTPGSPAAAGRFFPRSQAANVSVMRVDAPPFEPSSNNLAAAITFVETPTGGKRGGLPFTGPSERRSPHLMMPIDDTPGRDKDRTTSQYVEWSGHHVNSYHSHNAMRPFTTGGSGNSTVSVENLRGNVYELAKDQHGCRFLQRLLCDPEADCEIPRTIMSEIVPHVAELMTDQYANFLVQKLFDIMPKDVRYNVACVAAPKIAAIALTPHGTFSVQKMIETISSREELVIIREALSKDVVRLVKDANGNHAIQKVLQRFEPDDKEFVYAAVAVDCITIAKNKQGCCVLQRCLEYASPAQRSTLVRHILECCLQIAEDPYGNYVLQYVISAGDSKTIDTIAIAFLPHLVQLCMNKFSSNVMEKVLCRVSPLVQEMYVDTMCTPEVAARLIQDDFGNYVLQTALTICTAGQAEALVSVIRPLMPSIRNTPYAKKLEGKIESAMLKNANGHVPAVGVEMGRLLEMQEAGSEHSPSCHSSDIRAPQNQPLSG
ncbi:pumillio RNA binding protein, putative [Trypanosoma brucei gambiense DAL972]|uniref:Pumillio RNA binding protein, putative n=2 Tax=Trypanosoma brucei TaxID=5691 RepID=D0A0Z9_TRYB9|nr:pumillio RNA binding protein, putative [Trypanosoma brucei gambiense DAL972]CBH14941.1 pumillio RNA binding protein, putative [Trypanosoma brucei gambiense DAL972]|eukprot:XP_011777207.1 pumillio RNA binding protein, putative [Trypanosoma brucei gambiense DAL972]